MSGSTNITAPGAGLQIGLQVGLQVGLLAGVLISATACAAAPAPPPADRELAALQALVGDAACRDDTHCRTLPVGSLACGGPASYLPWSTLRSDETALKAAAAPLAQRQPGSGRGAVSICRVLPDPGARCARDSTDSALGTCRLRERSDGAGGALPTR